MSTSHTLAAAEARVADLDRERRVSEALLEIESLDPRAVLDRICRLTVELMPCNRATAYLYSNRARGFVAAADCGTPPHVLQRFVDKLYFGRSRAAGPQDLVPFRKELVAGRIGVATREDSSHPETVELLDALEQYAMCLVPFRSSTRGALFVTVDRPPAFDATALRIAQTVARQASNLVDHSRTFQKVEHAARIRAGLAALAAAVNLESDAVRIASLVTAEVAALFRLSLVALLVPQRDGLVVLGAHGRAVDGLHLPLGDDSALLVKAWRQGEAVFRNDLAKSPMRAGPLVRELGLASALAIPLVGRDGPLGCLLLGHAERRHAFSADIVDEALVVAPVTSGALERAALSRDLVRARDEAIATARLKSEFVANMSHEIRTPMNGVVGMADLLAESPLSEEQRDFVGTIRSSAEALLTVINDILDVSKIEAGKMTIERVEFDLRALVDDVMGLLRPHAAQKGLTVGLTFATTLPARLVGDPHRLRQVLTNLVGNAIKFTERGTITLAADVRDQTDLATHVRLSVRDTGIGIPPERHESIFDSFTQVDGSTARRYGGTGLGLTISRQLVELMGGRIGVESELGQGSTFRVEIPFEAPKPARDDRGPGADVADGVAPRPKATAALALRVLVADDDEVSRRVAVQMLRHLGCTADAVAGGAAALAALDRDVYDVLLLDVQMPDLDGFAVTAHVRSREAETGGHLPIVAMTAHAMEGDREHCLAAGMDGYLSKPMKTDELVAALTHDVPTGARRLRVRVRVRVPRRTPS